MRDTIRKGIESLPSHWEELRAEVTADAGSAPEP